MGGATPTLISPPTLTSNMADNTSAAAGSQEDVTANQERAIDVPSTPDDIQYIQYTSEVQMPDIMRLMKADLSEPYSIYTYRYFIHNWPHLCVMV